MAYYTNYKGRRALGARYSKPPEVILDEQRLAQEYALAPERARLAEQKRQNNIQYAKSQQEQNARSKSGMMQTVGNVAGMGLSAAKIYNDFDKTNKMMDIYKDMASRGERGIPIYDANNPIPSETPWGQQAQPLTPRYQPADPSAMYNNVQSIDYVRPTRTPINTATNIAGHVGTTGMSALGTVGSAYNAYNELQNKQYIPAAFDTATTGIGLYNTVNNANSAIDAINAARTTGDVANTATQATSAASSGANAAQGTASLTSSLGNTLPAVGAVINVGKGIYDTTQARDEQQATTGVWKMVDGVLQYVAPFYGIGRAASGLVNTGLRMAGLGENKTLNQIQSFFDPAGMAAGQFGDIRKLFGLSDSFDLF